MNGLAVQNGWLHHVLLGPIKQCAAGNELVPTQNDPYLATVQRCGGKCWCPEVPPAPAQQPCSPALTGTRPKQAHLGRAKCLEILRRSVDAIEVLTETWVRNQWFLPALVEKAKLLLTTGSWDQVCFGGSTCSDKYE
jgi:hypothetical protein